jgi:hypothetical protein
MALPNCDELFVQYFLPWYSVQDRERRVFSATRRDIEQLADVSSQLSAADISPITNENQEVAAASIRKMFNAATEDWRVLLGVEGRPSLEWIDAFDRHFQRRRIREILDSSDSAQTDNSYLVICCELGVVLGEVLQTLEPRLAWLYDWPYWESALYEQESRSRINVFHWAVKKMSEYAVADGLAAKVDACLKILKE